MAKQRINERASAAFALGASNVNDVETVEIRSGIADAFQILDHLGNGKVEQPTPRLAQRLNGGRITLQLVERVNGVIVGASCTRVAALDLD